MAKSCKGLAAELVKCLSESDCVKVQNRPYRECAKEKTPSISTECVGLRETYFNCKRGQKRIPTYDGCVCDQTKILNKSITQCRKGSHLRWDKRSDVCSLTFVLKRRDIVFGLSMMKIELKFVWTDCCFITKKRKQFSDAFCFISSYFQVKK